MVWNNVTKLEIYQLSMKLGDDIYNLVNTWDNFNRNTVGYQIVRAADSIPANISEGYGRFHFKDQRRFCFMARGSLFEVKTWLIKAHNRNPSNKENIDELFDLISTLHLKLNAYIKYLDKRV